MPRADYQFPHYSTSISDLRGFPHLPLLNKKENKKHHQYTMLFLSFKFNMKICLSSSRMLKLSSAMGFFLVILRCILFFHELLSWQVNGGREGRPIGAYELAKAVEQLGAGEILLNCIDCDGQGKGFDIDLVRLISDAVRIPVIASSGAGSVEHFSEVVIRDE